MPVGVRVAAGVTTGAFAITCAQPTDVVKVRMQAQRGGALVRYASPTHAYRAIATTEGVRGLWKGTARVCVCAFVRVCARMRVIRFSVMTNMQEL